MAETALQLQCQRHGRNGTAVITASLGEQILLHDTVNLSQQQSRDKLVQDLVARNPGIQVLADDVSAQLLKMATAKAGKKRDGSTDQRRNVPTDTKLPVALLPILDVRVCDSAAALGMAMADQRQVFCRDGVVVVVEQGKMRPVVAAAFPAIAERHADLRKRKINVDGEVIEVPATITESQARIFLATHEFYGQLPPITMVSKSAVLIERDGRLVQVTSYDRPSGILSTGSMVPDLTLAEAVALLVDALADFRFATPGDKSRALALFIDSAMGFGSLIPDGRVPAGLIEGDKSQAGKGYLAAMVAAVFSTVGYIIAKTKGGVGSVDERLAQGMIEGHNIIQVDNWRDRFDSETFEALLTARSFSARAPYRAAIVVDPRRTKFIITSNGLQATEDLCNRCSIIRILKQPDGYAFRRYPEGGILAHIEANQPQYLAAVFTVIQEWHRAGKPQTDECRHDFRGWVGILDWIVQNIFHVAPLMDGAAEARQHIVNPRIGWLRQVALHVLESGQADKWLRTYTLLDLLLADPNLKIPSLGENDDPNEDAVRKRLLQRIGRELGLCFQADTFMIDGITIERREVQDAGYHAVKEYRFSRPASPTGPNDPTSGVEAQNASKEDYSDSDGSQNPASTPLVGHFQTPLINPQIPLVPANPANGSQHRVGEAQITGFSGHSTKVRGVLAGLAGSAGAIDQDNDGGNAHPEHETMMEPEVESPFEAESGLVLLCRKAPKG